MCGIAGILRKDGGEPIKEWELQTLLTSVEYRGIDATGIALQQRDGTIAIHKLPIQAWKFITEDSTKKFLKENLGDDTVIALLHTRRSTVGNPHRNENNHPLYKGCAAVIHNGHCSNHDDLFREFKYERSAQTDSDILRAIVDDKGLSRKTFDRLNMIRGSAAAAAIHPSAPGRVMLLRRGNPLVLGATQLPDGSDNKLYWASDKRSIYRVTKPIVIRFNTLMQIPTSSVAFLDMYDDSGWIFSTAKGLEWHNKFDGPKDQYDTFERSGHRYGPGGIDVYAGDLADRARRNALAARAEDEHKTASLASTTLLPPMIYCPNPECKDPDTGAVTLLALSEEHRHLPLYSLQCKRCKTNLSKASFPLREGTGELC